ncbi:hypothetical protein [Thalassotalea euphylliae]|uniref:Uncharacterized protein n=1 Tax=Thalassotalea euphylliae TaxID=1655234 RepID=A0A3E0UFN2_9GAMM|nr:hypothetical protein [Thalassotalea euphylliae]REL35699.1 hypothetical protein DXX92_10305 [Thalassotalea euphylliae]
MENLSLLDLISLVASIASLILAVVAIQAAKSSEKEVRENFLKTQEMLNQFESRNKEVMAEIDKKSAVIERTVSDSQQKLMDTLTNILNETVIPKKEDMGEKMGMQMLEQMMSNPETGMQNFAVLADIMQKVQK